jgi:hypothetical protein
MKKEIKELIKAMESIKGDGAEISIVHKLYGDQKLRCEFMPIVGEKIGFNIKRQEIYINRDEINKICLADSICFADDVMEINIKTE